MRLSLIGQKFNRLTVVKLLGKKSGHNNYLCKCDCGNYTEALPTNFKSGKVKSCGCLKKESKTNLKHGLKKHYLYKKWTSIKSRCYIKSASGYENYGGKNIKIYELWKNDFQEFFNWIIENIGDRPTESHSIDRIDNSKDYEPNNLRWATSKEQTQNSSLSKINAQTAKDIYNLYYNDGKSMSDICKIKECTIRIVSDVVTGRTWNNITNLPNTRKKSNAKA